MKLFNHKSIVIRLLVGTLIIFSSLTSAAQPRFMGYYANSSIHENYDHTNMTHIWAGLADKTAATNKILTELGQAKQRGVKAIVMVESFVFNVGSSGSSSCPFRISNDADFHWDTFVNRLISSGYLVPNNPAASTVAAFYPVDEPDLCGLRDSGGQAHPALRNAVNAIRSHPATSNFPLAVLLSKKYGRSQKGIHLFDWAGLDNYSVSTSRYLNEFTTFQNRLLPHQRSILVPQASFGGRMMRSYGPWHNPEGILNRFLQDNRVIGIIPFLWSHQDTAGTRDIPELREAYTGIGKHIKLGTPLPMKASINCINEGGGFFGCDTTVTRGSPPYTYSWSNGSTSTYAFYNIQCGFPYVVNLTVTDRRGERKNVARTVRCEPGISPR